MTSYDTESGSFCIMQQISSKGVLASLENCAKDKSLLGAEKRSLRASSFMRFEHDGLQPKSKEATRGSWHCH